jgi:hypothetical protein
MSSHAAHCAVRARYAAAMSDAPAENAPESILDLANACVRYVKRALSLELDYTPDTLPLLDHYLRSAQDVSKEDVLNLLAPAAGAYFGEVVRRQLGPARWHVAEGDFSSYRLEFERCFLSFNPMGSALGVVLRGDADHYGGHLALLAEDQPLVHESLERVGEVREEDYFRLAVRFEVLEQVVGLLIDKAIAQNELSRRFGPDVYAALREQKSTGLLH